MGVGAENQQQSKQEGGQDSHSGGARLVVSKANGSDKEPPMYAMTIKTRTNASDLSNSSNTDIFGFEIFLDAHSGSFPSQTRFLDSPKGRYCR